MTSYNSATGKAGLYINGTAVVTGMNIGTGFNRSAVGAGTKDGIHGNAPFEDPGFVGTTNDFRVFDNAVTAAQAAALAALGPGATNAQINNALVPEPASLGVLGLSALGLLARRRRA